MYEISMNTWVNYMLVELEYTYPPTSVSEASLKA